MPTSSGTAILNNGSTIFVSPEVNGYYKHLMVGTVAGGGGTILFDGGVLSGTSYASVTLGAAEGAVANAVINDGRWRHLNSFAFLNVGRQGTGTLTVNGGYISAYHTFIGGGSMGQGSVIVNGGTMSSLAISVTSDGSGTFVVNGGYVNAGRILTGGGGPGGSSITVTGGTLSNSSSLIVGGRFNMSGGVATNQLIVVGESPTNQGQATITGGSWSSAELLSVGDLGSGEVRIAGGYVSSGSAIIGSGSTGHGNVTITSGTWVNSRNLEVGRFGAGVLNVEGGLVQISGTTITGSRSGGEGTVILAGNEESRGILQTSGLSRSSIGSGKVEFNGGVLRAEQSNTSFFTGYQKGDVTIGSGGAYLDSNGYLMVIPASLEGTGALHVIGAGVVSLFNSNSYTGGTVVESGTLFISANQGAGTGAIRVERGASLIFNYTITPQNIVLLEGGSFFNRMLRNTSFAGAFNASTTLGGGTTEAGLLDGVASVSALLQADFAAASTAGNDHLRTGGVLSLSGVGILDATTGRTDTFVLQLGVAELGEGSILGWLDTESNQWVNAVLGNIGGTARFLGNKAYDPDTDFALGNYGFDTANGTVWAVLNHNSDFAVVPEPGMWGLLGLGAVALLRRRRGAYQRGVRSNPRVRVQSAGS